ncbi:MAG TPA: methylamine methyltransferase corrinoid protein reductive activase [Methanomassiliicoccales archaeon]|jgi:methylamine methyltransferase corrinoid protein reductive activase
MRFGIALDLGTSGYRTHLVDLSRNGKIVSTAITMRHPLPGANIMDHLHFWIENGSEIGHKIITDSVDELIEMHSAEPNEIERIAVCGNPAQVSMFQNIEIRDLARAGQNALKRLNVEPPDRRGNVTSAGEIGLTSVCSEAEVVIPPSIRHEIGADALAMIIKTGILEKNETCMVTDYGTNAEMGLFHEGELYTGSAAAGPAMEGQAISFGMLAAPNAICDFSRCYGRYWSNMVLNAGLESELGSLIDPTSGYSKRGNGIRARGITGTGVVGAVALGLQSGIIKLPNIQTMDGVLHFQDGITFNREDLMEAGKAMGAIRAGHRTLIEEVGTPDQEIGTMYLAGASGTYVDPIKAQIVGMIPQVIEETVQVGNTSLMMAYDLVTNPDTLDMMQSVADSIASKHIMFASSKTFESYFANELAFWTEGMPIELYNRLIKKEGLRPLPEITPPKRTLRLVNGDIPVIGDKGLKILEHIGVYLVGNFIDCRGCGKCERGCPEQALKLVPQGRLEFDIEVETDLCLGTACRRCEQICPQKAFRFSDLRIVKT